MMIPINQQIISEPLKEVIDGNISEVERVGKILGLNMAYTCYDRWSVRVSRGDNYWTTLPDWLFVELQRVAKLLESKEK